MSKSKRRTKSGQSSTAATAPSAPAKPPAKSLPMLIGATVLLVAWLCVLAYLAAVSLSQSGG